MRWTFMSALNVRTLLINIYINCIVIHAPLTLSIMLEVDYLLNSSHSHNYHVIGFKSPT